MGRVNVTLTIDKEIYDKSHSLGINVSKACENYLRMLNQTIETTNNNEHALLAPDSSGRSGKAGPMGFEPMTFSLEGARGSTDYWVDFRSYVDKRIKNKSWQSTIFNYAQQYSNCLFKRDLSKVQSLTDSMHPNILKALSALAKFDGCSDEFKPLMKKYGLKWRGRSKDDVFIDRLTSTKNPEEIWQWILTVKKERPELSLLLDLMAVSGLRFIEGVNSCNLIAELSKNNKLLLNREGKNYHGGYFNQEISSLEHFWFRDIFLRNTKKAFVSFVPEELINKLKVATDPLSADRIQQLVRRRNLPLRFSDIREAHGTFMVKYLKESEINFLHGRISGTVFMANYFNPSLIGDLRERTFLGINEILQKVRV